MTKEIFKNPGVNDLTENDFFDYLTHDRKSIWEVFAGQDNEPELMNDICMVTKKHAYQKV